MAIQYLLPFTFLPYIKIGMQLNGRRLVGSGVTLTCVSTSRDSVTPL